MADTLFFEEQELGKIMQRFVNNPDEVVEDTVKGFVKAHHDIVRIANNPRVIVALHSPVMGKVGVITGGGSGLDARPPGVPFGRGSWFRGHRAHRGTVIHRVEGSTR